VVGFTEGRYEPAVLTRNRVVIASVTAAAIAACVIAGFATSWPMGNALASAGLVLAFGASFWWMFGSKKSGPVRRSDTSKYWSKRTAAPWKPHKDR